MNADFKTYENVTLLSGTDNMIYCLTENESKKCAFCQNFCYSPSFILGSLSCVTLALDLPCLAEVVFPWLVPTLFAYAIWELSDNVIINPLPTCLKKDPETEMDFDARTWKIFFLSCFLSEYILRATEQSWMKFHSRNGKVSVESLNTSYFKTKKMFFLC